MAQERRRAGDSPSQDDLFGKLDDFIGRHQSRPPRRRSPVPVPTLTEAVAPAPLQLEIPVLNEVVDAVPASAHSGRGSPEPEMGAVLIDRRKQLQVTLYLKLRQRLDEELRAAHAAVAGSVLDQSIDRIARGLRNALPEIVRDAVDQALAPEQGSDRGDGKL